MRDHFVYRAFDSAGRPLYVGCTRRLTERHASHRSTSDWYPYATRFTMAGPFDKATAYAYEKDEIKRLCPIFNGMPEWQLMGKRRAKRHAEVERALMEAAGVTHEQMKDACTRGDVAFVTSFSAAADAAIAHEFDIRCTHLGRTEYYRRLIAAEEAAA